LITFVGIGNWKRANAIDNPRLGILDLMEGRAAALIAVDRMALEDVLPAQRESQHGVPECDVLFLYADLTEEGKIAGDVRGIREIIRDSGAKVVVVASENNENCCTKTGAMKSFGKANLVITYSRRGDVFPRFFHELFSMMKTGVPMPMAWVRLAPQIPGKEHPDCPSTIFLCGAGGVRFNPTSPGARKRVRPWGLG
jgi:hypothetical protein